MWGKWEEVMCLVLEGYVRQGDNVNLRISYTVTLLGLETSPGRVRCVDVCVCVCVCV